MMSEFSHWMCVFTPRKNLEAYLGHTTSIDLHAGLLLQLLGEKPCRRRCLADASLRWVSNVSPCEMAAAMDRSPCSTKKTDMKMLTDGVRRLRRALPIPERMDHLLWDECFLRVWWRCSANFSFLRFPTGEEGDIEWRWVSAASTVQPQASKQS